MLKQGDTGPEVTKLQTFLNANGFRDDAGNVLTIDGTFGPRTTQAVDAFQKGEGLTVDGIFGPASEAAARALGYDGGTTRIEGVDVSWFCTDGRKPPTSQIDWPNLSPKPAFFWARSSYGLSIDPSYALHIGDGVRVGATPGAYHFFIAGDDPKQQATAWFNAAGAQPSMTTLQPALDFENNRTVPLSDAEAKLWATNGRNVIEEAEQVFGRNVCIYINPKTAREMQTYLDRSFWGARLLWLAEYTAGQPSVPFPWTDVAAHQFAGDVVVTGATCKMDRNVIYKQSMLDTLKS
jgi:peptidoglycan hydrolase-like protein with peptidoglycan-binding domain